MFKFHSEQKIYQIGNVTIGGQPGQYPCVLMASIFYDGDRLVKDVDRGDFDKEGALTWIKKAESMCKEVGLSLMIDIVGASENSMRNYIEFVGKETDLPFLIDGTTSKVRLAGVDMVAALQLQGRAIYNCVNPDSKDAELKIVQENQIKNTIVMLNNTKKPNIQGRIDIADSLIEKAKSFGFTQILLDMAVLDSVEPGPAAKTIYLLKDKYGYPSGCSPTHTIITGWKKAPLFSPLEQAATKTSLATSIQMLGADFLMYGIKQLEIIPAMAAVNAIVAYTNMQQGIKPATKNHPLYRTFK